ncbi:hypothetical protein [Vibrio phage phiKT1024]|nr:hypothetical protein [Vibrio phage phiKT1024]
MKFSEYINQDNTTLNEKRSNTVILGDNYKELIVQSPHGSVPFKQSLKVDGMGFEDGDRESNKAKQQIIKTANDKVNMAYKDLEKAVGKILSDAAKEIEKV